ncbi:MAG: hypothetical protein EPO06_11805 [Burkholderiaceae bacterium]|nr:MAG: hypothetical protein EPO06_11805 [Burkholderiaceae bacterium]
MATRLAQRPNTRGAVVPLREAQLAIDALGRLARYQRPDTEAQVDYVWLLESLGGIDRKIAEIMTRHAAMFDSSTPVDKRVNAYMRQVAAGLIAIAHASEHDVVRAARAALEADLARAAQPAPGERRFNVVR